MVIQNSSAVSLSVVPSSVLSAFDGDMFGVIGDWCCDLIEVDNKDEISSLLEKKGIAHAAILCETIHGVAQLIYNLHNQKVVRKVVDQFPTDED